METGQRKRQAELVLPLLEREIELRRYAAADETIGNLESQLMDLKLLIDAREHLRGMVKPPKKGAGQFHGHA